MNKKELIQKVAIRSGMSQADVERVLNHITDTVRDSLHNEESVTYGRKNEIPREP